MKVGAKTPSTGWLKFKAKGNIKSIKVATSVMSGMHMNSSIGGQPIEWLIDIGFDVSKGLLANFYPG